MSLNCPESFDGCHAWKLDGTCYKCGYRPAAPQATPPSEPRQLAQRGCDVILPGAPPPPMCATCADTAEMYGKLADAFLAYEQPLGLADSLGSFHPRLHRLVAALAPLSDDAQREAFVHELNDAITAWTRDRRDTRERIDVIRDVLLASRASSQKDKP